VLEVEPFDRDRLETIIADLERSGGRQLAAHEQAEIRKFLRVSWYHKLGYCVFCEADTKRPLLCRSPYLDPSLLPSDWTGAEEHYWLMWQARIDAPSAAIRASGLWQQAVAAIYLEILAKSLARGRPAGPTRLLGLRDRTGRADIASGRNDRSRSRVSPLPR